MKKTTPIPPAQYLNECLSYDPQTGQFCWKERPRSHFINDRAWRTFTSRFAGKPAGHKSSGQRGMSGCIDIRLMVNGKGLLFRAHRLAFILMGVEIPPGFEVDHKDCDRTNNVWTNLRLATRVQNAANQKVHTHRKYANLPKGVSMKGKRFRAQIGWMKKQIGLGTFATPEEAHAAYVAKAIELYGDFSRS